MHKPPRSPREVLDGRLWWRILLLGVAVAASGADTALVEDGRTVRQSALLVGLGSAMLGVAMGARANGSRPVRQSHWPWPANSVLPMAVAVAALLVVAVELPELQDLLRTTSPGFAAYAVARPGSRTLGSPTRALRSKARA